MNKRDWNLSIAAHVRIYGSSWLCKHNKLYLKNLFRFCIMETIDYLSRLMGFRCLKLKVSDDGHALVPPCVHPRFNKTWRTQDKVFLFAISSQFDVDQSLSWAQRWSTERILSHHIVPSYCCFKSLTGIFFLYPALGLLLAT